MHKQRGSHIKSVFTFIAGLAAALLFAAPCPAMDKVSVQLHWIHQAQFAGIYMAQDDGLYAKAGLEVEIRSGGPGIDSLDELAQGKCDFATGWLSGALEFRSEGAPIVQLAQIIQRSALLLVTLADRDISGIKDLAGRKVGIWGGHFSIPPRALFSRENIKVREVPQNASMTPLICRAVDAAAAMRYNEYHQLYQAGVDFNDIVVMDFADMGMNFPEDGLYTLEKTWLSRQQVCRKFTRATMDGWRLCIKEPARALELVMKRVDAARLASNSAHQRWMLKTMLDLITHRVGAGKLGELSSHDFSLVLGVLMNQGIIKKPVSLPAFYVKAWEDDR